IDKALMNFLVMTVIKPIMLIAINYMLAINILVLVG
ncbi:MAG: hypothetical protein RLZ61_32, partial [Planctomycetota bacterium]